MGRGVHGDVFAGEGLVLDVEHEGLGDVGVGRLGDLQVGQVLELPLAVGQTAEVPDNPLGGGDPVGDEPQQEPLEVLDAGVLLIEVLVEDALVDALAVRPDLVGV